MASPVPATRIQWLEQQLAQAMDDQEQARASRSWQAVNNLYRHIQTLADELFEQQSQQSQQWDRHDVEQQADVVIRLLELLHNHPRVIDACEAVLDRATSEAAK